jgi:hypothetical protein
LRKIKRYNDKKIKNLEELRRLINALELDEGIRIIGSDSRFKRGGFIFITKQAEKYCVNICDRIFDIEYSSYIPGGKEEFLYFSDPNEVFEQLNNRMKKPLSAWFY